MKQIFSLLVLMLLIVSCQNDDNPSLTNETDLKLVTGIELINIQGNILMQLGNPNIKTGQAIIYPNPAIDALSIVDISNVGITDVWIVKSNAQKIYQDVDFSSILNSNLYSESEIDNISDYYFSINGNVNTLINLENYETGYYKVFVKSNNQIEWQNIYVNNDGTGMDIDGLINFWD